MTNALRDNFRIVLYIIVAGCLILSATVAYRTYPHGPTEASIKLTAVATNVSGTNASPPGESAAPDARLAPGLGKVIGYLGIAFLSLVALSLLIARDISRLVANKVDDFIFNDDLKGVYNPEYEEAEKVWANGKHLEAIQLMRDYLKRHPREQYVALRIAEIYEADLANYLAAALEYEEVLKKKLPPERWGWAAIHLANLYSGKLRKVDEATQLLHRIINEFGFTAAAKKARERLGIPEAAPEPEPAPEPASPPPPPPKEPPPSNLPPGFRPRS